MGLFDLLFKSRATSAEEKRVETGANDTAAVPDSAAFLVPRDRTPVMPVAPRTAPVEALRRGMPASDPARQIVVALGDVIARIPPEFLQPGGADLQRELRFGTDEFLADIPRGRITVALSNIAAQCPEAFRAPITDDDDREVRLPLQKLLDQLVSRESEPARDKVRKEPLSDAAPLPNPPTLAEFSVAVPIPSREQSATAADPVAVESIPRASEESGERTIQLSLAAILAGCPDAVFLGERPQVDESVQVTLPFEPIERQLTNAVVEISGQRFVSLLPPSQAGRIQVREGVKIPLPLEEIFQNLPGGNRAERPAPPSVEPPAMEKIASAPEPETSAPVVAPPEPGVPEVVLEQPARFFAPTPPHPRTVPPPPLSVRPIGGNAPEAPHAIAAVVHDVPASSRETPLAQSGEVAPASVEGVRTVVRPAPALHSIEIRATAEAPDVADRPLPEMRASAPEAFPAAAPGDQTFQIPRPPGPRPLVVLPPPLSGSAPAQAAESGTAALAAFADAPLETTSDQTAVLEFLSEGLDVDREK